MQHESETTKTMQQRLQDGRKRLADAGWLDPVHGLHPIGTPKKDGCNCMNCRNQEDYIDAGGRSYNAIFKGVQPYD